MIKKKLIVNAKKTDNFLINFLKKQNNSTLIKPMKYGIISGGKKIRSTIILDVGKLLNVKEKKLIINLSMIFALTLNLFCII